MKNTFSIAIAINPVIILSNPMQKLYCKVVNECSGLKNKQKIPNDKHHAFQDKVLASKAIYLVLEDSDKRSDTAKKETK